MANIYWDSKEYQDKFNFVSTYGEDVISLIKTKAPGTLLDAGCGNGLLTRKLIELGYDVIGVDDSSEMIELFKENNPNTTVIKSSLLDLKLDSKVDVIFSNACFHWIDEEKQDLLAERLYDNLKTGGELVFEFGGYRCVYLVHSTLEEIFKEYNLTYKNEFYFPTIAKHSQLLEKHGFLVKDAFLFDRPTKQLDGLRGWILMFNKRPFENVDDELREKIIKLAEERLRDKLYINDTWYVDYTRIRMRAIKL